MQNKTFKSLFYLSAILILYSIVVCRPVFAQGKQNMKKNFKSNIADDIEKARDDLSAQIKKAEGNIQDAKNIISQARSENNQVAEDIGLEALSIAVAAKKKALGEKLELEKVWINNEQQLIEQRIAEPNKWCSAIYTSLKTKAPPLPYKKFNELQPGDVLLIKADWSSWLINKGDNFLSNDKASDSSHTVLFLKEVNGVKHFMENKPGEGPRIIFEDEFLKNYSARGAQVAKLAQPLDKKQAKQLYSAAVEMAAKNRKETVVGGLLEDTTNYGVWGKDNVVCSEADWALLRNAGQEIPKSGDQIKQGLGIDFSPADFYSNEQYFLVSPLDMPKYGG